MYGSAKTSTSAAEMITHILQTPGGEGLIGAATLPQLEQTAQKEFFKMFPAEMIAYHNQQKNYIDCINGFRVIFRPLDTEEKARSLNLTAFWIEECSEVKYEYFVQLQARLRNPLSDYPIGILSTNPDMGWIKTEFLLKSDYIEGGEVTYTVPDDDRNSTFATFIADTRDNIHLPDTYYRDTAEGKPIWWIRRYLHGSFENREGLVYPQLMNDDLYVEPFEIPGYWIRYATMDFGLRDPTAVLWGAIDPKNELLYLYKEHYESGRPVSYHARHINAENAKIPPGRLMPMVADPKGKARDEKDMRSYYDHYMEHGVYLEPASNALVDGIAKAFTYLDLGKVRIFNTLKKFRWEASRYKYPDRKLQDDDKINNANTEKPLDRDNHLMDTFRYLCQELPDDPSMLRNQSYGAERLVGTEEPDFVPQELRDEETYAEDDWVNYV